MVVGLIQIWISDVEECFIAGTKLVLELDEGMDVWLDVLMLFLANNSILGMVILKKTPYKV